MTQAVPAVLLPYQARWVADQSPVKVCEKSRRIGLSWCEAADDTLYAAATGGSDVWYVGYNREMAEEFISDCAFWAKHFNAVGENLGGGVFDEDKDILAYRLRFKSTHTITALSSKPANLRGKRGRIVIDEAAFHDDLPGLQKAAMAILMWGGSVRIISTHNGEDSPFNLLVQEIRAKKKPYSIHRITLQQALDDGFFRRICMTKGEEWSPEIEAAWVAELRRSYGEDAEEELDCVPSKGGGVYFPAALVRGAMDEGIPVLRWTAKDGFAQLSEEARKADALAFCVEEILPVLQGPGIHPHAATYLGEDFGRTGDLTCLGVMQETGRASHRAALQVELRNVPFTQQEQVLFFLADRLPLLSGMALDARGNGQFLAEVAMQRYGAGRVNQVMLTQDWYLENMPPYKAALEDRRIILPLDTDTLNDHRAIRMVQGVAKPGPVKNRGRDGMLRHGDAAIAWAMASYAARVAVPWDEKLLTACEA